MYKPEHFKIQELVDRKTFEEYGESAWMFLNPLVLMSLEGLRLFLESPIIVNNWTIGGKYEFSGFRPRACNVGADYSQHRFGNAFDVKCQKFTPIEILQKIMNNQDNSLFQYITTIEDTAYTPSWTHIDCRNIPNRIKVVKP